VNLFLNAVSKKWILILFNDKREILVKKEIFVAWNESEKLIEILDDFLVLGTGTQKGTGTYQKLENIVVVNWPWSFTGIRTIVLMVNTINFVIQKNLTPISFFDLFDKYPIIKSSSKRDSFIKKSKNSEIEILKNEELIKYLEENNIKKIYWDINFDLENVEIIEKINYCDIIRKINFLDKKLIEPYYIKKPSIS